MFGGAVGDRYVGVRQPNIRYIALSSMARLAMLGNGLEASIKKHQKTILFSLKDADVSIRQRALDLLFLMTDQENCLDIVHELLLFLVIANEGIKEEMVLKIAILAERFAPDYKWCAFFCICCARALLCSTSFFQKC